MTPTEGDGDTSTPVEHAAVPASGSDGGTAPGQPAHDGPGAGERPLAGVRVLLGVTGGIAAYKAVLLARSLVLAGATVDPILTRGAQHFVGSATFEGITSRPVRAEVWEDVHVDTHVAVGRAADLAVIYPATAHTLAKLAHGLADDLLTTTLLAASCPLVVAPAMHTEMWQHPATRDNLATLRARGVHVSGPAEGPLMGGDRGPGRVVDPDEVYGLLLELHTDQEAGARPARAGTSAPGGQTPAEAPAVAPAAEAPTGSVVTGGLAAPQDLHGRTVVVTAGGTREPIDPVRFLGNRSSGRMGFAVAAAAAERGAQVHLVAAPTHLPTPAGVTRTDVTTAIEMRDVVAGAVERGVDVVVKAAAVADFRPATTATSKLKKRDGAPTIELTANPDILAELGAARGAADRPVLVGFAAETDDVERNGLEKLRAKGADLLVVNDVSATDAGFEVDANRVVVLDRDGGRDAVELAPKYEVAHRILDAVARRLAADDRSGVG